MLRRADIARLFAAGLLSVIGFPAFALSLEAPLADTSQEARAKMLFYELRCVVCQGESIADSPADVASDLRREVRERIAAGEDDAAIKALLVSHYGDSILMQPPVNAATAMLWGGPLLVLGLALLLLRRYFSPPPMRR